MNSKAQMLKNITTPKLSISNSALPSYSQKRNEDQNSAPYPTEREARKRSTFLSSPANVSELPNFNVENDFFLLKPDQLGWSKLHCISREKADVNSFKYPSGAQRRTLCRLRPRARPKLANHPYLF